MISPVTNGYALCNKEGTWTGFDNALQYMVEMNMDGLAFVLKSGITFIDLDHVVDPKTGEIINDNAKRIVAAFSPTYTELSASRKGIHLLCLGNLPENSRNRNHRNGVDIEMYDRLRFVCITGEVIENRNSLCDYTAQIEEVSKSYVGLRHANSQTMQISYGVETSDDRKLTDKILCSKQAEKFSRLYAGSIDGYASHSQADSAFVWLLAFWTQNPNQIDRIFRSSGLYRPKWDRKLNNSTYGNDMISTALANVQVKKSLQNY